MRIVDPEGGKSCKGVVAALGVFDGVHLGHRELFREATRVKKALGAPTCAVTFHPHPRSLTAVNGNGVRLLTPPDEKRELMADLGADCYWQIPFDEKLARTPAEDFARRYLADILEAKHVVCGFNFTFGYMGKGTSENLVSWGHELGFGVSVIPPFVMKGEVVSSTRIRRALEEGRVEEAAECLGRRYCISGRVVRGDGKGGSMGIPTANLAVEDDKVIPRTGVYAALAQMAPAYFGAGPSTLPAVVNIGTRPTFGGGDLRVEAHVPGISGDLYGGVMRVFFITRLRDEDR